MLVLHWCSIVLHQSVNFAKKAADFVFSWSISHLLDTWSCFYLFRGLSCSALTLYFVLLIFEMADTCLFAIFSLYLDNLPSSRIEYTFVNKNFIYDLKKNTLRKIPGTIIETRMSDHRLLKTHWKQMLTKEETPVWQKISKRYLNWLMK